MSEITQQGYDEIINYIMTNWKIIKFYDAGNNLKLSYNISQEQRIGVSKNEGKIIITALLKGSDSDISPLLPLTLSRIALFKENSNDAMIFETFNPVTINSTNDVFYFKLEIQVPQEGGN